MLKQLGAYLKENKVELNDPCTFLSSCREYSDDFNAKTSVRVILDAACSVVKEAYKIHSETQQGEEILPLNNSVHFFQNQLFQHYNNKGSFQKLSTQDYQTFAYEKHREDFYQLLQQHYNIFYERVVSHH